VIVRGEGIDALRGRRVHVVGASGAEGAAVLLFLVGRHGLTDVVAHDFSGDDLAFARSFRRANPGWDRRVREDMLRRLRRLPVTFELGERYLWGLGDADVIFAGQNWFNYDSNQPAVPNAVAAGSALYGVVDLAMSLFAGVRIGVTGSNGKSTTSALLTHILGRTSDAPVLQGGNDRDRQVTLARLEESTPTERLVWEVSNRHLRDRSVQVDVAVVTNITRNHIDDHGSWEAYVEAKTRLPMGARTAVLSAVDPVSRTLIDPVRATGVCVRTFGSRDEPGDRVWIEEDRLLFAGPSGAGDMADVSDFALPGLHNRLNLCAAVTAAMAAGADPDAIGPALAEFAPLAGRLETVAERDGVRWVYDIQATTAPAATAGIEAIGASRRILLIVGGEDKGMDFRPMADAAAVHADRILMLPGSGAEAFLRALAARVPVDRFESLADLLPAALAAAPPGSTVLLSPGCAFFHRAYLNQGPGYGTLVRRLLGDDR
jgi:UDP-N-acetylmuramoylalanine--D-glutamate ligase